MLDLAEEHAEKVEKEFFDSYTSQTISIPDSDTDIEVKSKGTNSISFDINMPSEEDLGVLENQLGKIEAIREGMYTYVQRRPLTDSEMNEWREDMDEVRGVIGDLKYVLNSGDLITRSMFDWKKKVPSEDKLNELEEIYKRWAI